MTAPTPPLTIVTGASAPYARILWQMLRSARRHGLDTGHRFVVYDLGLTPAWRATLARAFPWCTWRRLDFAALPPHVAPDCRTYAWKPVAIHAAAAEFGGLVLWLDSATLFQSPLAAVVAALRRHGVYTLAGQSALQDRCDPAVWAAAGAPLEILHLPERAAGVVGFDLAQPVARRLLDAWHAFAADPRCWRPLSARHRPEQALLSILVYRAVRAGELTLNPGEIDISCADPVRWLTTRNKVPPGLPRWADPCARLGYFFAKRADRFLIRVHRWKATRVDGWHRYPREHFRVFVGRRAAAGPLAPTALVPVPAPRGSYYADPFLWLHGGVPWLFVEEFRYAANAGRLVAFPLDAALRPAGPAQPLALPGRHVSFPFLFTHAGRLLLLPESSAQRTVDLYACAEFPHRWELRRRLLADLDAADSVLLHHADRWWLFTSVRPDPARPGRALAIYHTADLLSGTWEPHPVNAELRYLDAPFTSGRCAGAFLRTPDGALLRPVHASPRYYGEGLRLLHVTTLTPTDFAETPFAGPHPLATLAAAVSPHHLSAHADLVACDVRDRVSYGQHLPFSAARVLRPTSPLNVPTAR